MEKFAILHEIEDTQMLVTTGYNDDATGREFEISIKFWSKEVNGYCTFTFSYAQEKNCKRIFKKCEKVEFVQRFVDTMKDKPTTNK